MQALLAPLRELAEYDQAREDIRGGRTPVAFSGCVGFALLALAVEALPVEAFFLGVGDAKAGLAVEAEAPAGVYVHRE